MNATEAGWLLGLYAFGDALLAAIAGVVFTFARKILRALDQRIEQRPSTARRRADGSPDA
jgi:hypothetical protein